MSQDPWEVESNPLDLNDGMDDRSQVPIAYTQAAADWLSEAGQALFRPESRSQCLAGPRRCICSLAQCLIALVVPLASTLPDQP